MRRRIENFIYMKLADEWGGGPTPPGTAARLEFGEMDEGRPISRFVATTDNNDGFELWIGYQHKWLFHCGAKDARRLAWFILWDWWAKGTWFGVKRKIWYWALSGRVRRSLAAAEARRRTNP